MMTITVCKAKLNRARVTSAKVKYRGSLTVDAEILEKLNVYEYEKVLVVNLTNRKRFETYIIGGERGRREIGLNGGAALLGRVGDEIGFVAWAQIDERSANNFKPKVVELLDNGTIIELEK